jgi:hypothetical protein
VPIFCIYVFILILSLKWRVLLRSLLCLIAKSAFEGEKATQAESRANIEQSGKHDWVDYSDEKLGRWHAGRK